MFGFGMSIKHKVRKIGETKAVQYRQGRGDKLCKQLLQKRLKNIELKFDSNKLTRFVQLIG